MASLRDKTLSGMFWALLKNIGGRGINFIVFLILARLLTPKMFGLTGMVAIFLELSQVLLNAGFGKALIQKKDADEEDFSTVFWINLLVSLLLYVILFFCAPWIAKFYEQPILVGLTRGLSLSFVINAFSIVPQAQLTKSMQFKKLTIIGLPSSVVGGGIGVVMAFMSFGVWSLVGLRLATGISSAILLWVYAGWKPKFTFNIEKAKSLFSFGGKLMLSGVINRLYMNVYLVLIGKFFPVSFVGYYNTSQKLVRTPSQTITSALNTVTFSAFSAIQDDTKRLKRNIRKVIQQVLFWLCPIFVLAAVLAKPLFSFVLTDKWLPAVPYFQILCVIGIFYPLNIYFNNISNVKGRSDLTLKLVIVTKVLAAIGIASSIPLGIWALVFSQSIVAIINYLLMGYFSGRLIGYSLKEQLADIAPIFIISLLIGLIIYLLDVFTTPLHDWLQVLLGFGVGGLLYLLIAQWKQFAPYLEFKNILRDQFFK